MTDLNPPVTGNPVTEQKQGLPAALPETQRSTYDAVADAVQEIADAAEEAFKKAGLTDPGEWDSDNIVEDVKRGIVSAIGKMTPRSATQPSVAPGSPFIADLDSALRHAEAFGNGDIHSSVIRKLWENHCDAAARSTSGTIRQPYLPLPWHYENRGEDDSGRWGDIISKNGKPVADRVYERDWYAISDAIAQSATQERSDG